MNYQLNESTDTLASLQLRATVPEPVPNWSLARQRWRLFWPCYYIGFAAAYGLTTVCLTIVMALARRRLSSQSYVLAVGVLLTALGLLRFFQLIVDPHESLRLLPTPISRIIYALPYPCLMSAFAFLQSYLVQTIKFHHDNDSSSLSSGFTSTSSPRSRNANVLLSFIAFYFLLVSAISVIVAYKNALRLLMTSYYFVDVTWTIVLCFGFVYNSFKVMEFSAEAKRTIKQIYAYRQRQKLLRKQQTTDNKEHCNKNMAKADQAAKASGLGVKDLKKQLNDKKNDCTVSKAKIYNDSSSEDEVRRNNLIKMRMRKQWRRRRRRMRTAQGHVSRTSSGTLPRSDLSLAALEQDGGRTSETSDCSSLDCWAAQTTATSSLGGCDGNEAATTGAAITDLSPLFTSNTYNLPQTSIETLQFADDKLSQSGLTGSSINYSAFTIQNEISAKSKHIENSASNDDDTTRTTITDARKTSDFYRQTSSSCYANPVFDNTSMACCDGTEASAVDGGVDGDDNEMQMFLTTKQDETEQPSVNVEMGYVADISDRNSPTLLGTSGQTVEYDVTTQTPTVSIVSFNDSPARKPFPLPGLNLFGLRRVKQGIILHKVLRMAYVTAFFCFVSTTVRLYSMLGVFSVLSNEYPADPWPWLAFQTLQRVCELGMSTSMAAILFVILRHRRRRWRIYDHKHVLIIGRKSSDAKRASQMNLKHKNNDINERTKQQKLLNPET